MSGWLSESRGSFPCRTKAWPDVAIEEQWDQLGVETVCVVVRGREDVRLRRHLALLLSDVDLLLFPAGISGEIILEEHGAKGYSYIILAQVQYMPWRVL